MLSSGRWRRISIKRSSSGFSSPLLKRLSVTYSPWFTLFLRSSLQNMQNFFQSLIVEVGSFWWDWAYGQLEWQMPTEWNLWQMSFPVSFGIVPLYARLIDGWKTFRKSSFGLREHSGRRFWFLVVSPFFFFPVLFHFLFRGWSSSESVPESGWGLLVAGKKCEGWKVPICTSRIHWLKLSAS